MALYRCSLKNFSRAKGETATAAAAYRAGVDLKDSRTGEHHRYAHRSRNHEVLATQILAPPGSPDWATDREAMWNKNEFRADQSTRPNQARVAREFLLALPHECSREQQWQMTMDFAQEELVSQGMIVDIAFHAPSSGTNSDQRNFHVHLLCPTRTLDKNGEFGNTNREWNQTKFLEHIRLAWEHKVNRWLEHIGSTERVDSRSLKDQGLKRLPTQHMGKAAWQMEQGNDHKARQNTRIGDKNREIQKWNSVQELAEDHVSDKEKLLAEKQKHLDNLKVIDLEIEREKRRMAEEQKRKAAIAQSNLSEAQREKARSSADATALLAQRQHTLRLKQLDERRTMEAEIDRYRHQMEASTQKIYNRDHAEDALKTAQIELKKADTTFGRLSGRHEELSGRVEALRLNLEDIDRRQNEQKGHMDRFANDQLAALDAKHHEETERLHDPPSPDLDTEAEDFREYTPDSPAPRAVNDNENFPDRDPDPGPELDR